MGVALYFQYGATHEEYIGGRLFRGLVISPAAPSAARHTAIRHRLRNITTDHPANPEDVARLSPLIYDDISFLGRCYKISGKGLVCGPECDRAVQ